MAIESLLSAVEWVDRHYLERKWKAKDSRSSPFRSRCRVFRLLNETSRFLY